jgi:signal transduction histidine kinase
LNYYALANGIVAGICLSFGIIYLFIGLRRKDKRKLYLLFAAFALAYGGTLINSIRWYNANSLEAYVSINRQDSLFVVVAFLALMWYVAEYTAQRPRLFLLGITTAFMLAGFANLLRSNLLFESIEGLYTNTLPWGEELAYIEATDSVWSILFLFGQLILLAYLVYACIRQFMEGERNQAIILSIGVVWFVAMLIAEIILAPAGLLPPLSYGEFGFLGFVVAMSLQMANSTIKIEEELAAYRLNLEEMVADRTADLKAAQVQLLAQTQETAIAEERGHIARELHDVVTQILFSINLIAISLPRLWKRDPDAAERSTNELQRLTRGALAEMRILLRELRPHTIAEADLGLLLTQLSHSISARHDIEVDIQVCSECNLPPEVHVTLYRIAQEATTNITKHAEASHLDVSLEQDKNEVRMAITDDGKGFNIKEVPSENMGLGIMQERADAIGADLIINSRPGAGTKIAVTWPIPQAIENADE